MKFPDDILIVFVRNPTPGQVKTRLAAALGDQAACKFYASFVPDMLEAFSSIPAQARIFFQPPGAKNQVAQWLGENFRLFAQAGEDLGSRMANALESAFQDGAARAVLVGSDLPDLPAALVQSAFQALGRHDVVLGPAQDGGYYLIGFTRKGFAPAVFSGPQWGGSQVLEQTLRILSKTGASFHLLPSWRDVDEPGDLLALHTRLQEKKTGAPRTLACLEALATENPGLYAALAGPGGRS